MFSIHSCRVFTCPLEYWLSKTTASVFQRLDPGELQHAYTMMFAIEEIKQQLRVVARRTLGHRIFDPAQYPCPSGTLNLMNRHEHQEAQL
ncbi:extracellular calcium-sensing receptor-like protein [Lates japonicus]|uniref:Extracellular calcium-sensing receptor-like protein n=1 Tax=Lates japonicus TaxID=270547 RepID=A0AAD3NAY3_LATJO|nr:extracellular calcium-sensing receptor-like protein [Lates japonicus]